MVKVSVLGSTGMLGNSVLKELNKQKQFEVFGSYRKNEFADKINSFFFNALEKNFDNIPECDYIINCIGIIKPYMLKDLTSNIYINSIFPHELSEWCKQRGIKLIHITTDCVFTGNRGFYTESDKHDCTDEYGKSKSLGEPLNCMTLRTSIIGEEIHSFSSLISWVKSQDNKTINGYTNHFWNGMTTNQFGKCCEKIMLEDLFKEGLYHIHSDDLSKFELVTLIKEVFGLNIEIEPKVVETSCNRSIRTIKELNKKLNIPSIKEQLNYISKEKK